MTDRELMQMALDTLESKGRSFRDIEAIKALRDRLAQPEPEPVAWFIQYEYRHEFLWREPTDYEKNSALEIKPLFTAPPKREWVGLKDVEITDILDEELQTYGTEHYALCQAIEAKLKEKNK